MRAMITLVTSVLLLGPPVQSQAALGTITGTISYASALPLPGTTISARGADESIVTAISKDGGAFTMQVASGSYLLRATLPGFVPLLVRVAVGAGETRHLNLRMTLLALESPDHPSLDFATYYKDADAVAHLRIELTHPPLPCDVSSNAHHLVSVVSTFKGELLPSIWLNVANAGPCLENGARHDIDPSSPYSIGSEHLAFLRKVGDEFSVAGVILLVRDGRIASKGWGVLRQGMTLQEVATALRSLP